MRCVVSNQHLFEFHPRSAHEPRGSVGFLGKVLKGRGERVKVEEKMKKLLSGGGRKGGGYMGEKRGVKQSVCNVLELHPGK